MSCLPSLVEGKQQLQRYVWIFASEVRGTCEVPVRIYESELHAVRPNSSTARRSVCDASTGRTAEINSRFFLNHPSMFSSAIRIFTSGFQPVMRVSFE